ncbi:zeta-sarcoglycan-like [Tropilaelaps mercedesae]|uniref:Zeta-sarcoglycan-like n=1 Tax=Tropilaelaps mercedesae TaxID=418985 RepID=A0A1V9XVG6_9ACAR|nr:zeta-sarcoglycan-like [Tropilaelaps mercedesae]
MASDDDEPALQVFNGGTMRGNCGPCGAIPVGNSDKRSIVLAQHGNGRVVHTVHQNAYSYPLMVSSAPSIFDGLVIDIRGWRKRYLLVLLITLSWLVALNLMLTLWISRAINFSLTSGLASIAIKANSLRADDIVNFLDDIAVKNIHSRMDEAILVQSMVNITLSSTSNIQNVTSTNYMSIAPDRLDAFAESFSVHSADGRLIFRASEGQDAPSVTAATHTLKITGRGGVRFADGVSVQTPVVAWGDSGGLRVESATRELLVEGPRAVTLDSSESRLVLESNGNLTIASSKGKIILSADSIHLDKLRSPLGSRTGKPYGGVYQLCGCGNGRLFLAAPAAPCRAHHPRVCGNSNRNGVDNHPQSLV